MTKIKNALWNKSFTASRSTDTIRELSAQETAQVSGGDICVSSNGPASEVVTSTGGQTIGHTTHKMS